jgi:ABC-2 type transport system ATP-binding protein
MNPPHWFHRRRVGLGWSAEPAAELSKEEQRRALGSPASRRRSPDADEPAVLVEHLSKRFEERLAVEDVSFSVAPGEVFGFLGPNGAGKTTTVRMLSTLIAPTSGTARVAGVDLSAANGVEIRRRIAVMTENPGLYLRLTVAENLDYFAGLYELAHPRERIERALVAVNLAGRASDLCGSLSKGLRQRVALARALLSEPAVVFLDEPTSGLDPVASREVHELIDGLREHGVTVFLTTHRLEEAERVCDRVAILNTSLRTIGRPDELRDRLFTKALLVRTAAPLRSPETVFAVPGVDGWHADGTNHYVLTVRDARVAAPEVTRALVAAGADVLSLAEAQHSLEDVYLELVDDTIKAPV